MIKKLSFLLVLCFAVQLSFSQRVYHVIVGSSKNRATSKKILTKYKDFKSARIILSGKTPPDYRVEIMSSRNKIKAIKLRNQIRRSGRSKDVWILVTKEKKKPIEQPSNSEFMTVFREFAEDTNIPFDVIDNYRNGSLQDLLYNKIQEIPTYLLVVDLKYKEKANKISFDYYLLSKEELGKTKAIIKNNTQAMGIDLWSRLLEGKETGEEAYDKLDPNSIREFYWQDLKYIGYKYSFEFFK